MAPSKKRKKAPPSRTLLDFFSNPRAIKRARASRQLAPSARQAKREIIVIDSDNDGEGVDEKDEIKDAPLDPWTCISEDSLALSPVTSALTDSEDRDTVTFGVPSALLQPLNPRVEVSSNAEQLRSQSYYAKSMFGGSAPLLEQPSDCSQLLGESRTNPIADENISNMVKGYDPLVEFRIGEWAVGDDELAASEVLSDSTGIDEGEEKPFDQQQLMCPVCCANLAGIPVFEAQCHVNQCLDSTDPQDDDMTVQKCPSIAVSIKPNTTTDDGSLNKLIEGQGSSDVFTVLMNSRTENGMWVEADAVADRDFRPIRGRRRAPFYKVLQGMPIAVDAFCYGTIPGVTAYFLSHAHSDHYTSLGSKWTNGPIYCSEETANLIIHMLAINPKWIHPLPWDTPMTIPDTGGVSVTLIEANHCPGSCLFFFEGQQTVNAGDSAFKSSFVGSSRIFRYLHCGDFRASPRHVLHPAVKGQRIDHIYLDTTYLDPKYTFSPQPLVVSACAELIRRLVTGGSENEPNAPTNRSLTIDAWVKSSTSAESKGQQTLEERVLVIVGTYSIGKERLVKAVAQALGAKIYCDPRKTAILRCQADKELHALLTPDPVEADVHLLPLATVTSDNLKLYLQGFKDTFSRIIGFRPTGWTYSPPSGSNISNGSIQSIISRGQSRHFSHTDLQPSQQSSYHIQIFGVPYSEHSSFLELTCFAMSCDWDKIIPTVNVGSPTVRAKMTRWLKRWKAEKRSIKVAVIPPRTVDYW